MTKRIKSKRVVAVIIVLVIALSLSSQAYAAPWDSISTSSDSGRPTGSFSGITGTMNALGGVNGGNSARWPISLPSLPPDSVITGIALAITVRGDPCYLYIQSPDGIVLRYGPFGQGTYTITVPSLNGAYAQGTWYFWIQTLGTITTATLRITFYYFYP